MNEDPADCLNVFLPVNINNQEGPGYDHEI